MRGTRRLGGAVLLALTAGCGRDGESAPEAPPAFAPMERRVEVRLSVPGGWRWNLEDTVRVTVVNGTADTVAGTLHLFASFPLDAGGVPPGADVLSSGEGTRISLQLTLPPGATAGLRQAVRTPPADPGSGAGEGDERALPLRAWFSDAGGTERAAAAGEIRIPAGSAAVEGGCGGVPDAAITRYGIGPVRLEMRASEVRSLCPEARDTVPSGGRPREAGLAVRIAGHPVLLLLSNDRVERIVVDTPGPRTAAGAGVGATLGELRGRYGRVCAGTERGGVVVRFPAAPGIAFGLDTAVVRGPLAAAGHAALPDSARVSHLSVRADTDDCPLAAAPSMEDDTQ